MVERSSQFTTPNVDLPGLGYRLSIRFRDRGSWALGWGMEVELELDQASDGGEAWCQAHQGVTSANLGDTLGCFSGSSSLPLLSYKRQGTCNSGHLSGTGSGLWCLPLTGIDSSMAGWWWCSRPGG